MIHYNDKEENDMPFIRITTNRKLTLHQEIQIKEELGKLITIIPNKKEENLMIHMEDNQIMYFKGEDEKCMMVSIALYKESPLESKQLFACELIKMLEAVTTIPASQQYVSFMEYPNWGKQGKLV